MIGAFAVEVAGYRASLDPSYSRLLQQLVHEILVVLDEPDELASFVRAATEPESSRPEPGDPTLDNLLPPMSNDPPEAARLRALTEDFLRSEKSVRLRRISRELLTAGGSPGSCVVVARPEVWDWLAGLNDVRLALAGELGIECDADAERVWLQSIDAEETPAGRTAMVCAMYTSVTWWQDSLLRAMREDARSH